MHSFPLYVHQYTVWTKGLGEVEHNQEEGMIHLYLS